MILAWIGAILIGITLGLLGSGGSILTVPVLTYLVGQDTKLAIASSLIIVCLISLFSALSYAYHKQVKWRTVFLFGLPGMLGALAGAWSAHFISDAIQMLIFSILLLIAAYLMFDPLSLKEGEKEHSERSIYQIVTDGFIVGLVTGIVGVGGGFLIIPALILLGGLSIRLAIGTSLVIVTIQSFAGFIGYLPVLDTLNLHIDWQIIILFSVLGVLGSGLGHKLSKKIKQAHLKKGFAFLLLIMGFIMLYKYISTLI